MNQIDFNYVNVTSIPELERAVSDNIGDKNTSYFYFYSSWDEHSNRLAETIRKDGAESGRGKNIYLIDIFDVPNAVGVMRSVISELKPTISLMDLRFTKLPSMVCLHKAFPRLVEYNGSIYSELGL